MIPMLKERKKVKPRGEEIESNRQPDSFHYSFTDIT